MTTANPPRFGEYTFEEIAKELGVTRERVRQIERIALTKCRRWCKARGLDPEALLPAERELSRDLEPG